MDSWGAGRRRLMKIYTKRLKSEIWEFGKMLINLPNCYLLLHC